MGLLDNMKSKLGPAKENAKEKVSGLAQQHGGKIQHGIERAAKIADDKTKHKYSEKIEKGTGKTKQAMDRLAHQGEHEGRQEGERGRQEGERGRHARPDEGPKPPPPTAY